MNNKHTATIEWILVIVLAVSVMLAVFYVAFELAGVGV